MKITVLELQNFTDILRIESLYFRKAICHHNLAITRICRELEPEGGGVVFRLDKLRV